MALSFLHIVTGDKAGESEGAGRRKYVQMELCAGVKEGEIETKGRVGRAYR